MVIKQVQILNDTKQIAEICKKFFVNKLYVFGSVLTDKFNNDSDVDFLVSFNEDKFDLLDYADNYFGLIEALEKIVDRKVDVVVEKTLSNPFLIKSINLNKHLLYEAV